MSGSERRLFPRLMRKESLLLRRKAETPPEEATLARGQSVDVSADGLCIETPLEVRPGDGVDVWVAWSPNGRKYLLAGEVRWSAPAASGHAVGVAVTETPATDFVDWRGLFTSRLRLVEPGGE
jgi:hypothetical protein